MSLLDEIIVWAGGQKAWQQEALRRIFSHPELVQQDIDDLLDMVRGEEKEDSASKPSDHFPQMTSPVPVVEQRFD